jgi:hypothetical protein
LYDYPGKDHEVIGEADTSIIGPPGLLSERTAGRIFPSL